MLEREREEVVEFARRMVSDGLVVGTSGNVSVRAGDLVAVTPSGTDYGSMTVSDVVVVDLAGEVVAGSLRPTSELPLHLVAYREHGAGAVVHTHSPAATALSLLREELPPVHYQIAMFGGSVLVAPYATFGTEELRDNASRSLEGRSAVILKHHGTLTTGGDLRGAYDRARQLEWLCDVYLRAAAVAEPVALPADEIERVVAEFADYGQPPTARG
ncbi:class II aldolase/adducin family protein [Kineococcus sp. GCM10028916]|uniref:class II aldolase/adducin family protein n=1 Tax=Kineococcus sp. GCM10028916 TaxID=3273394 RepID=UPI00363D1A51